MTTCVFAQTSLHMLYAKINLENSQLSKQHVKTTLQYAANSFHKTWRFPEAVISILFQHRRWGQGHRLSGSTPPIFRWDRSRSQSKTVWLMFLSLNQAVSSLLALSRIAMTGTSSEPCAVLHFWFQANKVVYKAASEGGFAIAFHKGHPSGLIVYIVDHECSFEEGTHKRQAVKTGRISSSWIGFREDPKNSSITSPGTAELK
jgi:hypothetical protein